MTETWPPFDWADPLLLDSSLREEERLVRDSARNFAQSRLMPLVRDMHRQESFDRGLLREMGALGLLGSTLPEFGGASPVSYGLIAREVERVDSAFRSSVSVQSSLVMHPIHEFGSAAQRQKYLPKLASGEWVGAFGLTEPNSGSDPGSMQSRARKTKTGFVLSGSKSWITHAPIADVLVVWAKLDDRVRGFILERGDKGLTTPKIDERCRNFGRPHAARCRRIEGGVLLSQSWALRHFLGRDGCGGILLACGAQLWAGAQAVRTAAGRQSALSKEAGRYADRNHFGSHRLLAGRAAV
jgi:alkylation response protein AidB-like acyl-CoA dehydrogenase